MTDWFVGQKAECIYDNWSEEDFKIIQQFPILRRIYTVRGLYPHPWLDILYLWLEEITNEPVTAGNIIIEPCFNALAFRPLVDTKTDISLLERLLNPVTPKVKEFT